MTTEGVGAREPGAPEDINVRHRRLAAAAVAEAREMLRRTLAKADAQAAGGEAA